MCSTWAVEPQPQCVHSGYPSCLSPGTLVLLPLGCAGVIQAHLPLYLCLVQMRFHLQCPCLDWYTSSYCLRDTSQDHPRPARPIIPTPVQLCSPVPPSPARLLRPKAAQLDTPSPSPAQLSPPVPFYRLHTSCAWAVFLCSWKGLPREVPDLWYQHYNGDSVQLPFTCHSWRMAALLLPQMSGLWTSSLPLHGGFQ